MPTLAASLRACRAPLLAYAASVAAALVLMILLVIAIAIADGGSSGGDGGDPSSEIDIKAIGTLIGIPFQVAAMALGGSLGFGDPDFSVSLFAPPLLVTAVFLLTLFLLSRRAEARTPSVSTPERAVLAASGAFGTAVVALVLTRALAMRDDGVAAHAAGFGLFFGVLVVGGTVAFLGRQAAVTSLWPRWLPADGRRALHLSAQHLLLGVLVLIPITPLWWLVDTSVEAALFALIWSPTVAMAALGMGHLGAVTAGGEHAFAWDLGWFPGVVLPLIAVLLAVVASMAWHLRRGSDRGLLAHPASWVSLPVTYALAALALCLVSTVGMYGELWGVGGGVWFHLAYWLIPVLALWGGLVEALSRFVAPALVGALPAGLARLLGRGPAHLVSAPVGPVERIPMSPADQARARKALIGGGIVAVVALVGGIAFSVIGSSLYGPESRAEAYLDALVEGDAESAVDLAPVDDDEAGTALLTNEVYGAAEDRITGYEIDEIDTEGSRTTVTVDLEGIEDGEGVELVLEADGSRGLFFKDWKVADGGLASTVSVSLPEGSSSLEANGVSVEADGQDFWALPGTYSFNPYDESEWLESSESLTTVNPGEYFTYAEFESPQPSQALVDEVDTAVADYLATCMASTELEPDDCPQNAYAYGDESRNVVWTLTSAPTLSWEYFDGNFPFEPSLEGDASASVRYEYDASYGYGRPDWTKESGESSLYFNVTVDLVDDEPVVTFETY